MVHAFGNTQHTLRHYIVKMVAINLGSVENDSPAKNPEDSSHTSWNNSQTHMLIAYFRDKPILSWDQIEVAQL